MRKRLKASADETGLARILDALKQELIEASDEEVQEAARDLGMNLELKESAAFAGLTYPSRPQLSDFFELEAFRHMPLEAVEETRGQAVESSHAEKARRRGRGQSHRESSPGSEVKGRKMRP